MTGQIEDIPISGDMIRLGQLLKFSGVSDSGAEAGAMIADGDVRVDGEIETRRGRQLSPGAVVDIAEPGGVRRLRVVAG